MSLDFVPTGVATGVSGSIMGTQVITTILAAGNYVVPVGCYYAYALGADVRMQIQDSLAAWNNVLAAGAGGFVASDGTNIRFINNGAGSETVTLIKIG